MVQLDGISLWVTSIGSPHADIGSMNLYEFTLAESERREAAIQSQYDHLVAEAQTFLDEEDVFDIETLPRPMGMDLDDVLN